MQPQTQDMPYLVMLSPGSSQGRRIPLTRENLLVGRDPASDIQFDDMRVSRSHAALSRRAGRYFVQDLGSSGGTLVNDEPCTGSRELHPGDVVTFAAVQLRYGTGATGDETSVIPTATPVSPRAASARSIRYEIGQQHAGAINNVAGNQSISYTQIKQQRENFLREIAATRTKARWLVWSGFLCFVLGFALFASSVLGFLSEIFDAMGSGSTDVPDFDALGRQVAGVPVFALGWGTAAVGMLLLVVGVVLHVIATSRRKRVDREFVLPPPGQTHTS